MVLPFQVPVALPVVVPVRTSATSTSVTASEPVAFSVCNWAGVLVSGSASIASTISTGLVTVSITGTSLVPVIVTVTLTVSMPPSLSAT